MSSLAPVVIKSHVADQQNFSVGQISWKLAMDFLIQTAISPLTLKHGWNQLAFWLAFGLCPIQYNLKLM